MRFVRLFTLLGAVVAAPILVLAAVSTSAASAATRQAAHPAHARLTIHVPHPLTGPPLSSAAVCDGNPEEVIQTLSGHLYVDPSNNIVNGAYSQTRITQWCVINQANGGASAEYRQQGTSNCLTEGDYHVIVQGCGSRSPSRQTWFWTSVSSTCPTEFSFFVSEYEFYNSNNVLWGQANDTPVYFATLNCTAVDDQWGTGP